LELKVFPSFPRFYIYFKYISCTDRS